MRAPSSSSPADLLLPATALVVARGPDARHARGLGCPLAVTEGGATTVTCSGLLLPSNGGPCRVLVPASAVAPFVDEGEVSPSTPTALVAGTTLSVSFPSCSASSSSKPFSSSFRVAAWLKLPGADAALSRLSREGWETGWALSLSSSTFSTLPTFPTFSTSTPTSSLPSSSPSSSPSSLLLSAPARRPPPPSAAWLAVLEGQGPAPLEAASAAALLWASLDERPPPSSALPPGTPLLAAGAPLGGLSAPHFSGCVLSGAVSAIVRDEADVLSPPPLLLADLPGAFPGADGGPVVALVAAARGGARFAGVLVPPLRQRPSHSSPASAAAAAAAPSGLPLVVTAGPLAAALREAGMLSPPSLRPQLGLSLLSPLPLPPLPPLPPPLVAAAPAASSLRSPPSLSAVEAASRSVVALLVPGSSWASAVHVGGGVFLTAGHAVPLPSSTSTSTSPPVLLQLPSPGGGKSFSWEPAEVDARPLPPLVNGLDVAVVRLLLPAEDRREAGSSGEERRSRRLPLLPLAALLAPFVPLAASAVAVLGFPRLHPRANLGPLATFGVVSKTLSAAGNGNGNGNGRGDEDEMLLSTCGVLAGASGGAVVALSPSSPFPVVVALVVSNTRHLASGTTLAHLNYAVCGAALRACWEHARELIAGGGEGGRGSEKEGAPCILPPLPMPPSPEARAALWALAAVPRNEENGGGAGGERRGPQGKAALDRLLERAGISLTSSSSPSLRAAAATTSDWPSRL